MNKLERNYEIVAVGDINLKAVKDSPINGILSQNKEIIEGIWQRAQKKRGEKLFDGTLPNFIRIDKKGDTVEITSHFIQYKQFIAQKEKPALELGIKPIAISGMIILGEGEDKYVLFAKRDANVTLYPGFIELVPSGGINEECTSINEEVDYQSQLLSEFAEETGLPKDYVKKITGFALVLDIKYNVYDICCEILLKVNKQLVEKGFSSKEYNTPVFVNMSDLDSFIEKNIDSIVPTSIALIEAYRKKA
jgi:hypothetical protein